MAISVLTNVSVVYNSIDLSDHVESVVVQRNSDQVDITAMGATAHAFTPGLSQDKITINFYQDFATSKVHATLNPLYGSAAGAVMVVKPVASTVSTTNPSFTATVSPYTYDPINGAIGVASMTSVDFYPCAGSAIVVGTT